MTSAIAFVCALLYYGASRASYTRFVRWFGRESWFFDMLSWLWPVTLPLLKLVFSIKYRVSRK